MHFSVPKFGISSCIHVVHPIREIEKTSIVGFFCLIPITILGWGLWFTYWGLYDIISELKGLSDADARNKGNLLAWCGLLLGSVDVGEPLAWGRGWSWGREGGRMSIELPRKGGRIYAWKKKLFLGYLRAGWSLRQAGNTFYPTCWGCCEKKKLIWSQRILPADQMLKWRGTDR